MPRKKNNENETTTAAVEDQPQNTEEMDPETENTDETPAEEEQVTNMTEEQSPVDDETPGVVEGPALEEVIPVAEEQVTATDEEQSPTGDETPAPEDHGHDHEHTTFSDLLNAELSEREVTPEMQNAILGILRGEIAPPKASASKRPGVCLCGCGGITSPGRNYLPGHDAKVKGYISRALAWAQGTDEERKKIKDEMRIPQVLLDHLDEHPDFVVGKIYDAQMIRYAAEVVGTM